ncbi:MAG: hypothetical protein HWE20_04615 [Gammaproteobacteria bacterium]|nr:hypothetical protein [Gammaproteobacteria bacterium]
MGLFFLCSSPSRAAENIRFAAEYDVHLDERAEQLDVYADQRTRLGWQRFFIERQSILTLQSTVDTYEAYQKFEQIDEQLSNTDHLVFDYRRYDIDRVGLILSWHTEYGDVTFEPAILRIKQFDDYWLLADVSHAEIVTATGALSSLTNKQDPILNFDQDDVGSGFDLGLTWNFQRGSCDYGVSVDALWSSFSIENVRRTEADLRYQVDKRQPSLSGRSVVESYRDKLPVAWLLSAACSNWWATIHNSDITNGSVTLGRRWRDLSIGANLNQQSVNVGWSPAKKWSLMLRLAPDTQVNEAKYGFAVVYGQ